jgi:hypothetical protein
MAEKTRQKQDDALVESLARGATQSHAARLAGCGARTVHRRLADPEFRSRIEAFRAEMLSQASGRLAEMLDASVSTLADLLKPDVSPTIRLAAARAAFEYCLRTREIVSLEARIAALEDHSTREAV